MAKRGICRYHIVVSFLRIPRCGIDVNKKIDPFNPSYLLEIS
jgi:hypothetical protein